MYRIFIHMEMHTEITELSAGMKLFLSEMGSCCIRTVFVHHWSEEVMNMSLTESVGDVGLVFFCFLKDLPSGMKLSTSV